MSRVEPRLDQWVRASLWITAPFNFVAAFAFAMPSSPIGNLLDLPRHEPDYFTFFSGAMVGIFGMAYFWSARQATLPRPIIAVGAGGKFTAVLLAATLFVLEQFSAIALLVISGDLLFVGLWTYWLIHTRT